MKIEEIPLKGLVLAGGKSRRMQKDKGLLNYHGLPQREFAYRLLETVCDEVFLSVAKKLPEGAVHMKFLVDFEKGLGPIGALLTAFEYDPDSAWLVLACDMPLVGKSNLEELISKRNPQKPATAFLGEEGMPEPLFSIWEPNSFAPLKKAKESGKLSPRKLLATIGAELARPSDAGFLANANTPEDFKNLSASLGLGGQQ
ncbi:NTP transferase domain-containing protein [Flammeovirgaceae bacterium SG7u.111]|nr:NTP transferase domain-containing protein [Flammeovirgaceae bacterium SG7u.132]WPO38488.1 NTP transferase domain-containing protein [Flammeovirgaceae bacterium SG7u.111]